ncbi:MAG: hypothetical protein B7Z30_08540, partial [Rhizobiales bacterium 12-68-15]
AQAPWDRKGFSPPGGGPSTPRIMDAFSLANGRAQAAGGHTIPAVPALLSCVYEGLRLPIDTGLRLERKLFGTVFARPEPRAMIRTLFFAKQAADKLARRPAGIPPHKTRTLGIIGAGFMGRGIAEVAARAGISVVLLDRDGAAAEAGHAGVLAALDAQTARGRLAEDRRDAAAARLTAASDFAALAGCDLVIEAAPEDRALKARLGVRHQHLVPPPCRPCAGEPAAGADGGPALLLSRAAHGAGGGGARPRHQRRDAGPRAGFRRPDPQDPHRGE